MTNEQAIIQLEYRKDFATPDQIEALDMAISALSTEGEYIKKSELLQHVTTEELSDFKDCDVIHAEEIDKLPTYSFPDSAIEQLKWERDYAKEQYSTNIEKIRAEIEADIERCTEAWHDPYENGRKEAKEEDLALLDKFIREGERNDTWT